MHGYGVGRFTAKCRRGAEQPPRVACLPFTYRTPRGSSWPSSNPTTLYSLFPTPSRSRYFPPVVSLSLSAPLRSSPITLFAFRTPRRGALPFGPNYHPRASVYRSDVETPDATVPLCPFFLSFGQLFTIISHGDWDFSNFEFFFFFQRSVVLKLRSLITCN